MSRLPDASHPTLILVRGIPGSGKSYLAAALKTSLGKSMDENLSESLDESLRESLVVTLDPDSTDYSSKAYVDFSNDLAAQGVDPKFHPYRFVRAKAYAGITGRKVIIWNQPFTQLDGFEKTVGNLQAYAVEHGTRLPLLVVEVAIDHDTAKARVADRKQRGGHGPSEATFDCFIRDYASFSDKGYDTVTVHGEDDVSASVATIMKALET